MIKSEDRKDWPKKIRKTIDKKDSRFWLMIFVLVSTTAIFVLWSLDLKNTYSSSASFKKDSSDLGLSSISTDLGLAVSDFSEIFGQISEETDFISELGEEIDNNSREEEVSLDELDKLKQALENRVNGALLKDGALLEDGDLLEEEYDNSSVPALYPELDDSEQTIMDLKKRIEELESKLD